MKSIKILIAIPGEDGSEVELSPEDGSVVFKVEPDFETKNIYSFVMTVTNIDGKTKDIDVTINIIDVLEDLDSLPSAITESVNENSRFALAIPEYKDTNSYVFSGVDGDKVKLWAERGEVIFNYAPDFETQASYNFIMTVTSATESVKEVDVTLNITDISDAFIFEVLAGSIGNIDIVLNDGQHETQYDTYSFTVKRDEEAAQEFNNLGTFSNRYIHLIENEGGLTEMQRFTITPSNMGGLPAFRFNAKSFNSDVKVRIIQWGDNPWGTLEEMLSPLCGEDRNTDSLSFSGQYDSPNLSGVSNLQAVLLSCNLTENLGYWDVSSIKNMTFAVALGNGSADLSQWDVSSVENMEGMLQGALEFNSDLSQWDVSSVINMRSMFRETVEFNVDLPQWKVESVEDFSFMFAFAEKFNADISDWKLTSAKNMSGMFGATKAFNSDISQWNVSTVENMDFMFQASEAFNQDVRTDWNVTNVTSCTDFKTAAVLDDENVPNFQNCTPTPAP